MGFKSIEVLDYILLETKPPTTWRHEEVFLDNVLKSFIYDKILMLSWV